MSSTLKHLGIILLPAALIMLQPDLGSTVILIVSAFVVLFVAGYSFAFLPLSVLRVWLHLSH